MRWAPLVVVLAGCAVCRPPAPVLVTPVEPVCLAPPPSGCVEPETLWRALVAALELAVRLVPNGGSE